MSAREVLAHIAQIRQRSSIDLQWQLMIAASPNQKPNSRRQLFRAAASMGKVGEEQATSVYDMGTEDDRIRMIGSDLSNGGPAWQRTHGRQMRWLREQNVSVEQAVERYETWLEEKSANPFFTPATPQKARRSRR